ncbi:Rho GTPase activation protein [Aulographum hederae CBS 113979]|uniref:Rho GTPase activation protein n=1 Tax=Aulographum hederae CBS 113979 TaxID=1176131 RepID=A0A6G1GUG4_9PEZI|nr:Rho GTPase activation protein [Aulographum hederae CBS 113979]
MNPFRSAEDTSQTTSQTDISDTASAQNTKAKSTSHVEAGSTKRSNNKTRVGFLSRSRSIKDESRTKSKPAPMPTRPLDTQMQGSAPAAEREAAPKTAPLDKERPFRDMMNSSYRNRSADRQQTHYAGDDRLGSQKKKDNKDEAAREGSFLTNIRSSGTKAADGIKSGRGLISKMISRSGSSNERQLYPEDTYVCQVINLKLVEQTRRTRISKRLQDSKDKTEYWMPALPWRCIDFLNMRGCEQEGLYRIPGSIREIKRWQMRFDTELDINLFDEPELHDINIIGSMFKAWLRDLKDEIFPKATQFKIQEACLNAKTTPQMLKDELSKLPPFNYYLLFAITCHISLLHSCSQENKMDYRNLCICFQPCMKIEPFCFQWLVLDWRNCWQGCWTEKEYLAIEEAAEAQKEMPGSNRANGSTTKATQPAEDRNVSSSGSSKPSITSSNGPEKSKPAQADHSKANGRDRHKGNGGDPQTATELTPPHALKRGNEVPSISPMKPLSPFGPM